MVGSLTGAVSSQRVTEEYEDTLRTVGHRLESAMAKVCLTASATTRAGAKAGHSDPAAGVCHCGYDLLRFTGGAD